jgi:hypothetical protein
MTRTTWQSFLAAFALAALTSCSSSPTVGAHDAAFAGLDQTVVAEVLANSNAMGKIKDEPAATQKSLAQAIVANFILCRAKLRSYQVWRASGQAPTPPPMPKPAQPLEPGYYSQQQDYALYSADLKSGDIDQLRLHLTNDGSCGNWIPSTPGGSETINHVVTGK